MRRINQTASACLIAATLFAAGCSSIECPLNSHVSYVFSLGDSTLTDTLTISTTRRDGSDTVLINKNVNTTQFTLPASYVGEVDEFLFDRADTAGNRTIDTVRVMKDDLTHFEAVDCNPAYFHTLKEVWSTHNGIDSLRIVNKNVTYDQTNAHIEIYFKPDI